MNSNNVGNEVLVHGGDENVGPPSDCTGDGGRQKMVLEPHNSSADMAVKSNGIAPNRGVDKTAGTQEQQVPQVGEEGGIELLSALYRDYEALQKRSVKGCLRSKTLPCPEVASLLEKGPVLSLSLQQACKIVMESEEYLGSFHRKPKSQSSLWYMSRLGTAIRLLQLLLSRKEDLQDNTRMLLGLLQVLSSVAQEALNQWKRSCQDDDEDDVEKEDLYCGPISEAYDSTQVACFVVAFLLKTKSLFLEQRPELLPALWKSLDPVVQALSQSLPVELLQEAIQALCGYLKEFLQQSLGVLMAPATQNSSMHPQQLKLFTFFLSRLASYLKLVSKVSVELEQMVVEDVLSLLTRFRGLAAKAYRRSNNAASLLDCCQKIAIKAEKCLLTLLLVHQKQNKMHFETILPHQSYLQMFLKLQPVNDDGSVAGNEIQTLGKDVFHLGKVHTTLQLLQELIQAKTKSNSYDVQVLWALETNVDLLLGACEYLIFDGLPQCHGVFVSPCLDNTGDKHSIEKLLDTALQCVSTVLYQCETLAPCMTINADRGAASFHRLLLWWLLPYVSSRDGKVPCQQHPLTRELMLSIVCSHAVKLYGANLVSDHHNSQSNLPFLELLVKVLFDTRTTTAHREIAAVLCRRIFAYQNRTVSEGLQRLIQTSYSAKRPLRPKKRKRTKESSEKSPDKMFDSWLLFSLEDMQMIATALSLVPATMIANSACDVERFCLLVQQASQHHNPRRKKLTSSLAKMGILAIAFIEASLREDPSQTLLKQMTAGLDLYEVQDKIITWFLLVWDAEFVSGKRTHAGDSRMRNLAMLGSTILRFIAWSSVAVSGGVKRMSQNQIQNVYQIVNACTDELRVLIHCTSNSQTSRTITAQTSLSSHLSALVLESAEVLGVIGKVAPVEYPESVLQGFVGIFQRILSTDTCWSLRACTVTSLHAFSTTLQRAHRHLLPACIPKRERKGLTRLLQCRIQGTVYSYDQHSNATASNGNDNFSSLGVMQNYCSEKLKELICSTSIQSICTASNKSRIIPALESLLVEPGSYLMTMPTQEGRKAIVIFPPDESSLKDIRYMLGEDTEDDNGENIPAVQRLHHVLLSQGSCRMLLKR
jgi:hypothetical protein